MEESKNIHCKKFTKWEFLGKKLYCHPSSSSTFAMKQQESVMFVFDFEHSLCSSFLKYSAILDSSKIKLLIKKCTSEESNTIGIHEFLSLKHLSKQQNAFSSRYQHFNTVFLPITKLIPIFLLSVGVVRNGTVSLNIQSFMTKKYTSHKKTPETAIIKPPNNMKVLQGTKSTLKSLGVFCFFLPYFFCFHMLQNVCPSFSMN